MTRMLRTLRILTAVVIGASAVAFTIAVSAERSNHHHETAAEHAAKSGTPPAATSPASPPAATTTSPARHHPTPKVSTAREEGSTAREGSAEHEAAEHATATPKPHHSARPTSAPTPKASDAEPTAPASEPSENSGEGSASHEAAEHALSTEPVAAESEKLFGINIESTPVIAMADVAAALLIAAALLTPAGGLLALACAAIIAFGVTAAGLDVREAVHQHREARPGLLAAAVGVAVLHVIAAVLAAVMLYRNRVNRPPIPTDA